MVINVPKIGVQGYNQSSLYQSNDTSSIPNGTNVIQQPKSDCVSFTSKSKEDKNFVQKHWGKMLLGAIVVGAGVLLTKGKLWDKPPSFEKVQQNLAEIFGKKNLSKEETEAMLAKYQDIHKIKDKKEFITKLFEQVKSDFGYGDNKNIYLTINDKKSSLLDALKHKSKAGEFYPGTGELVVYSSGSRHKIFSRLCHEFTHVKQYDMAFKSTGAKEKLIQKYIENSKKDFPDISKEDFDVVVKTVKEKVEEIFEARRKIYGNSLRFEAGSADDILAKKYYDAGANYVQIDENYEKYKNNLLEQEAYHVTSLAEAISKYFT